MWRIKVSRPVVWLVAMGTVAIVAILIVIQSRTIREMRQEIRSLHAEIEQLVEQARNTEAVSNAGVKADASKVNPEEPSQELLRLRGEVGLLRQEITELQKRSPGSFSSEKLRHLETLRRDIEADSVRLKVISERLHDAKLSAADRAQTILSAGFNDALLNTLLEKLGIAEQRHGRLAKERGDHDGEVQDAGKRVADLSVTLDERCQGLLIGLESRVSSMKLAAEELQAELQKSATGSR